MTPLRRKPPDPELAAAREAFLRVATQVDVAQRALLSAVPTARDPGIPLAEALERFLSSLSRSQNLMPAWRMPPTQTLWDRCERALTEARASAEALRSTDQVLGFEALNARLGDIISPLEEFADTGAELRHLHRR